MVASRFGSSRPTNVVTSTRQVGQTVYPVGAHSHDTDHRADFGTISLNHHHLAAWSQVNVVPVPRRRCRASRPVMLREYRRGRVSREQWRFGTAMTLTTRNKTL